MDIFRKRNHCVYQMIGSKTTKKNTQTFINSLKSLPISLKWTKNPSYNWFFEDLIPNQKASAQNPTTHHQCSAVHWRWIWRSNGQRRGGPLHQGGLHRTVKKPGFPQRPLSLPKFNFQVNLFSFQGLRSILSSLVVWILKTRIRIEGFSWISSYWLPHLDFGWTSFFRLSLLKQWWVPPVLLGSWVSGPSPVDWIQTVW